MPDLAVRWNCKAGKCGSCSMEINGKPRLACMTRMNTFAEDETITVTPLRAFPVIRDLVTDVSYNYRKAMEIPSFAAPEDLKPGEYRMAQVDVERSQEFRKCIECFLCQDTCHVIRDHEENKKSFAGPRFFIRIAELDMHPLDRLRNRKQKAQEEHGLGMCNITKCCTEVCPEHIKITDNAIIPMKERVVDVKYDPIRWLGSKIRKREGNSLMNLVKRWVILALAFWLTTFIVSGIEIEDGAWNYFWVAALFGVVNTFLGGLLKLFTLPAVILTFGLFVFVINAAMLTLVDRWSDVLTIDKFTSALIGALIISLISGFTNKLVNKA
jgi:succinate dehydrogenase and fumarate reductase iron-sulfur protein